MLLKLDDSIRVLDRQVHILVLTGYSIFKELFPLARELALYHPTLVLSMRMEKIFPPSRSK